MATTTSNSRLTLKSTLEAGRTAYGTFTFLKGGRVAQVVAHTGLDAVVIDCEHGNIDDGDMHDMVTATAGTGASPVVRVRAGTADLLKRALDTGAHGVLVPMVNTAAQAREVVQFSRYPPVGTRGQGGPFAHFELGLPSAPAYVKAANDAVQVMVQIETQEAVANVDEICAVEGVDMIFIGPNDLSLSTRGFVPANFSDEAFVQTLTTIVDAARRHGKKTGILAVDGATSKLLTDKFGFDFIVLGGDVRALQGWYARELQAARQ